jgi:hypothetical protein
MCNQKVKSWEKLEVESLQPGSEFDNFKPWLKSGVFKLHLLAEWFVFWGVIIGFF